MTRDVAGYLARKKERGQAHPKLAPTPSLEPYGARFATHTARDQNFMRMPPPAVLPVESVLTLSIM